eukprot:11127637-Ditylum_brightwellii.AAC.1
MARESSKDKLTQQQPSPLPARTNGPIRKSQEKKAGTSGERPLHSYAKGIGNSDNLLDTGHISQIT